MSNGSGNSGPIHPRLTARSRHSYLFYNKHHQGGAANVAQWLPQLTNDQEFEVFDLADQNELLDASGNLYGMRPREAGGSVPILGTRFEQAAKFPVTPVGQPWHGYPIWPIVLPSGGQRPRSLPRAVLSRMVLLGLISDAERRRFQAGKHI